MMKRTYRRERRNKWAAFNRDNEVGNSLRAERMAAEIKRLCKSSARAKCKEVSK